MFIDTYQLATEGIGPGYTLYSIGTSGYTIDVIPVPPTPIYNGGGGSTVAGNIAYAYYRKREKVKVKVSRDGREWEEEFQEIDIPLFLKENESIEAKFLGVKVTEASARFIKYMINTDNVIIKVKKL